MIPIHELIPRLMAADGPDRRLDAEIVAAVNGPPGCVLNPFETPEGWDIELAPDKNGETGYWMEAADVPRLTGSLDEACAFLGEARPSDGASIAGRALASLPAKLEAESVERYAQQAACALIVELLRATAVEHLQLIMPKAA